MTGVVGSSIETISGAFRSFFTAEYIASEDGFLQRRDPRVSVLSIAGLALAVMITRSLPITFLFGIVTVALAWISAVPLRRLLVRSAVVPLVSALIVLPQAVLMPGDKLIRIFDLVVTDAGVVYIGLFTLRVGVGISLLSLIVMTMPFSAIVAAMRDLRIPIALVWVIAVTYRYLFLFFDELQRLILARNSRTKGATDVHGGWRDAQRIMGTFLLRTLDRGERVGRGMRARGGARPPSPYSRSQAIDAYDFALITLATVAIIVSGVMRWFL